MFTETEIKVIKNSLEKEKLDYIIEGEDYMSNEYKAIIDTIIDKLDKMT